MACNCSVQLPVYRYLGASNYIQAGPYVNYIRRPRYIGYNYETLPRFFSQVSLASAPAVRALPFRAYPLAPRSIELAQPYQFIQQQQAIIAAPAPAQAVAVAAAPEPVAVAVAQAAPAAAVAVEAAPVAVAAPEPVAVAVEAAPAAAVAVEAAPVAVAAQAVVAAAPAGAIVAASDEKVETIEGAPAAAGCEVVLRNGCGRTFVKTVVTNVNRHHYHTRRIITNENQFNTYVTNNVLKTNDIHQQRIENVPGERRVFNDYKQTQTVEPARCVRDENGVLVNCDSQPQQIQQQ